MEENAIEVSGLGKQFRLRGSGKTGTGLSSLLNRANYRTLNALDNINFSAKKGETIGVIGLNGAGKTTLLKILTGIIRPSAGAVKVSGKPVSVLELGISFQGDLTARENIYLYAAIMGMKKREVDAKFEEIIGFAELQDFVETPLKDLSAGMQLRLAFSTAIQVPADIFLVDEVLAVGDLAFQKKCFGVFKRFQREGKTIVLASHSMQLAKSFCEKVLWLENGMQADFGEANTVLQNYADAIEFKAVKGNNVKDLRKVMGLLRHAEGWLRLDEGAALLNFAKKDKAKGVVVELRPFKGRATICLAAGCKEAGRGKVYSIGTFRFKPGMAPGDILLPKNSFKEFSQNIERAGLLGWVLPIEKDYMKAGKAWKKPIRLLSLCTLLPLSYQGIKKMFSLWEPHVAVGGLISFSSADIYWPIPKKTSELFINWFSARVFIEKHILTSKKFKVVSSVGYLFTVRKVRK